MVHEAVAAAERVTADGISVEVVDLRTVAPLDTETILESLHKTSRILIAHEAVLPFGIGAEIAATVARGLLGSRRTRRAYRRGPDAAAVRPRPRARVAPRPRRHRRSHSPLSACVNLFD